VPTQQRTRRDPTGHQSSRFTHPIQGAATELVVIRHGQTAANIAGLLVGRQDVLLTELGHRQAERTARAVHSRNPDALISSPLQRARQTTTPIAEHTSLYPQFEDRIAEFSFGDLEGWSERDALEAHPHLRALIQGQAHPDVTWPNGESGTTFLTRIFAGVGEIVSSHPDQRVAVVTHGGVIGSFVASLIEEAPTTFFPYLVHNCSVSTFSITAEGTTVTSWDNRDHLDGLPER
jgi:broad specificity phosphatase PhoE